MGLKKIGSGDIMDRVECLNCGNIILFDFRKITCSLVNIRENIFIDKRKNVISSLDLFNKTIECCHNPDYCHIGD